MLILGMRIDVPLARQDPDQTKVVTQDDASVHQPVFAVYVVVLLIRVTEEEITAAKSEGA